MQIKEFEIKGEIAEEQVKEVESFIENHHENDLWATFESMFGFDNFRKGLTCYKDVLGVLGNRENLIGLKTIITMDTTHDEGKKLAFLKFFDKEPNMNTEFIGE